MGTGRKFAKKPTTRPKKSDRARRRRDKVQRARLVATGVDAETARKMNSKAVRFAVAKSGRKAGKKK